jgi:hypothetical protein
VARDAPSQTKPVDHVVIDQTASRRFAQLARLALLVEGERFGARSSQLIHKKNLIHSIYITEFYVHWRLSPRRMLQRTHTIDVAVYQSCLGCDLTPGKKSRRSCSRYKMTDDTAAGVQDPGASALIFDAP